eukprot:7685770-Lingulodinium_polyedra.AAC.1
MQCSELLRQGQHLSTSSRHVRMMFVRVDGIEQAEWRAPRTLWKSHLTDCTSLPVKLRACGVM